MAIKNKSLGHLPVGEDKDIGALAHSDLFAFDAEQGLRRRMPELSASTVITRGQIIALSLLFLLAGVSAGFWPDMAFLAVVIVSSLSFFVGTGFRGVLTLLGGRPAPSQSLAIAGDDLPIYTILVPLYREARVLPRLVHELSQLDYPTEKLDIKLIVEADDADTAFVADYAAKRGPFEVVRVPAGSPRTKPRACNYAMLFARGEFTVIYDAEDRPEADQLRKAVAKFRSGVHARLFDMVRFIASWP